MEDLRKAVQEIRESQIRMEADLKYHIKRTDLLEAEINSRYTDLSGEIEKLDADVVTLKQPLAFFEVVKIAGVVSAMVASMLAILKYINIL